MKYRKSSRRGGETGSFWLSFSDMMSVLVLIFIFVIFAMLYSLDQTKTGLETLRNQYAAVVAERDESVNAQQLLIISLNEAETERDAAVAERDAAKAGEADAIAQLAVVQNQLDSQNTIITSLTDENKALNSQMDELSAKYIVLAQDKAMLEQSVSDLDSKISALENEVAKKQAQYDKLVAETSDSAAIIAGYETELASYKKQLEETQRSLEMMLGVKTRIIEELSNELQRNHISVDVDRQTGAISLEGGALFDSGKTELKSGGMSYLDSVMPIYIKVLMSDEFRPYIAEIVIEGHTDSTAKAGVDSYLSNMELSQQRALAVANYLLDTGYMKNRLRLNTAEQADLRSLISTSGRSFSALKYKPNGEEDKNASRRVEIKFRLKDDETIDTTRALLGLLGEN